MKARDLALLPLFTPALRALFSSIVAELDDRHDRRRRSAAANARDDKLRRFKNGPNQRIGVGKSQEKEAHDSAM